MFLYKQGASLVFRSKESTCQCSRCGFDPWVGKIPWSRKWQPTPVFLPRKFHGQRRLKGCSPWGHKRVRHNLTTVQQQIQRGGVDTDAHRWMTMWGHKEKMVIHKPRRDTSDKLVLLMPRSYLQPPEL